MSSIDALLDALADRIAVRIGATRERETYSSRALPPLCSRRRFAELCRAGRVADARREGCDWVCSRGAWQAARTRRVAPRPITSATSLDARAEALLARNGLRVLRGTR